jgi:predicted phage tail protein
MKNHSGNSGRGTVAHAIQKQSAGRAGGVVGEILSAIAVCTSLFSAGCQICSLFAGDEDEDEDEDEEDEDEE